MKELFKNTDFRIAVISIIGAIIIIAPFAVMTAAVKLHNETLFNIGVISFAVEVLAPMVWMGWEISKK